jgi:hypothetical protein
MSERVTNLELEDVLSSIRRLVTNAAPAPVAPAAPDRLILTPSLRVASPAPVPVEAPAEVPVTAQSLARTIAELETALGVAPGEWEPDGSETVPVADWSDMQPLAFRPALVPEPEPQPAPVADSPEPEAPSFISRRTAAPVEPSDADEDAELEAFLAGDSASQEPTTEGAELTIDEASLRAMVADVLREELQGELGERITRNVRKLVRREIYRVLNSEETS